MVIKNELLEKISQSIGDIDFENKVVLYGAEKEILKTAINYKRVLNSFVCLYILTYSMINKSNQHYQNVIISEFLENTNMLLKNYQDNNPSWDLDDETIKRFIEQEINK